MLWDQPGFLCACCERIQSSGDTALLTVVPQGKGPLVPHSLYGSFKENKMSFPCQEFNTFNNDDFGLIQARHQVIFGVRGMEL